MTTPTRDRPWHRGLDREGIARTALQVLDEEGRDGLTMRRLAAALDVQAASLYAHVRSKDDLVDAVLDQVLDAVVLPEPSDDPRGDLIASFSSYRRTLKAHPGVVPLIAERSRMSAAQMRLVARSIELLEAAGLDLRGAIDAHVTLIAFVLGFIVQEVGRPASAPAPVRRSEPLLERALSTLAERSVDERFDVGLGLILDGAGVRAAPSA